MADAKIVLSAVDQTKAAFDSVQRNLTSIQETAAALPAKFGTIGLAISSAFAAVSLAGMTQVLDDLDALSERTGQTVESLSELRYVAELSDTNFEALATGVKKLSVNMVESEDKFKAMGVSVRDASGRLRDQRDVLLDIADKFVTYQNGAGKTALAVELFGKTGDQLIGVLNRGSEGIRQLTSESRELGAVFSGDAAKAAGDFNDNLTRMRFALEGTKVEMLGGLLPALNTMIEQLRVGRKEFGGIVAAASGLAAYSGSDSNWQNLTKAREAEAVLQQRVQDLSGRMPPGFLALGRVAELKSAMNDLDKAQKATRYFESLNKLDQGRINAEAARLEEMFNGGRKNDAPNVSTKTAATAAAASAYDSLNASISKRLTLAQQEDSTGRKLTDAEKVYAETIADITARTDKLTAVERVELRNKAAETQAVMATNELRREEAEIRKKTSEMSVKALDTIASEVTRMSEANTALREEIELIGATDFYKHALTQTRLDAAIAAREEALIMAQNNDAGAVEIALIQRQIELLRQRKDLERGKYGAELAAKIDTQEISDARRRTETMSDSIAQGILDGYRRGGNFTEIFLNELKAQFAKTVLSPMIQPVVGAGNGLIDTALQGIKGLLSGPAASMINTNGAGAAASATGAQNYLAAFADGGRPPVGLPSLVGERGQELFIPDRPGTIIPNDKLGGQTITFAPVIHIDSRTDAAYIRTELTQALATSQRQLVETLERQRRIAA